MQLCDLWHGAASAPWNMCKQPPRDAVPCQSHPGQRRRGEGTEPLRTRPSAAAVQGLYSASLERRGNSTPLPQDSWTHRVSLCLFFLWQVFPTCHGLRFLLCLHWTAGFSCTRETRGSKWGLVHTVSSCMTLTCCHPGKGQVQNCINTRRAGCHNLGLSQLSQSWGKLFADSLLRWWLF